MNAGPKDGTKCFQRNSGLQHFILVVRCSCSYQNELETESLCPGHRNVICANIFCFPICQTEPDDKVGQRTLCSVTTISPSVIQIRGFTGARSPASAVCIMCHAHWIRWTTLSAVQHIPSINTTAWCVAHLLVQQMLKKFFLLLPCFNKQTIQRITQISSQE